MDIMILQQAVMLMASVGTAIIRAQAMAAENAMRAHCGKEPAYVEADFLKVIDEEGIDHNRAVSRVLR